MTKLVFYYPCKQTHHSARIHGPMGLAYLAAHLEQELGITDVHIEIDPQRVLAHHPDVVGISSYTETYPDAVAGAELFKKQLKVPVILGGPHVSAIPALFPTHPFDVGVVGEGELTLTALLKGYQHGQWGPNLFNTVEGVVYWDSAQTLQRTHPAEGVQELDLLHQPRRELMQTWWPNETTPHQWGQGLYTSRDCPFRCNFCVHSVIKGFPRYHSVERVIAELNRIVREYPQQTIITIYDDIFVVSKKRLKVLVDAIRSEGLHRKVGFIAMVKPSAFDHEIAQLLKAMNVQMIGFGFESASKPVLKYLKGQGAQLKHNQRAIDLCREYGFSVTGYFILGSPVEQPQDLAKTYWFVHQNRDRLDIAGVFRLIPYPGTQFWVDYQKRAVLSPTHVDWNYFHYKQMDENYRFFINPYYSQDFLNHTFNIFRDIQSRLPSAPAIQSQNERLRLYKHQTYARILDEYANTGTLLEIGATAHTLREYAFHQDIHIPRYEPHLWRQALAETAPVWVLTHGLEQLPQRAEFWRQAPCKTLVIMLYNPLFWPAFEQFLNGGQPDCFEPLEQWPVAAWLTLARLGQECSGRWAVSRLEKFTVPLSSFEKHRQEQVQLFFQNALKSEIPQEWENFSYVVTLQHVI